jgi:hypothetical protein
MLRRSCSTTSIGRIRISRNGGRTGSDSPAGEDDRAACRGSENHKSLNWRRSDTLLVDPLSDVFLSFERYNVVKVVAFGHRDDTAGVARVLVGDILQEQQRRDVSLYWEASMPPRSSS